MRLGQIVELAKEYGLGVCSGIKPVDVCNLCDIRRECDEHKKSRNLSGRCVSLGGALGETDDVYFVVKGTSSPSLRAAFIEIIHVCDNIDSSHK